MPTLSPSEWLTLVGMAVVAVSSFVGVREATKGLKDGQREMLRQQNAFHKRLDFALGEISRIDKGHVRLEERVNALRDTQRMRSMSRRAITEAEKAGEPPMFEDGE
jgi:hypothetical protein